MTQQKRVTAQKKLQKLRNIFDPPESREPRSLAEMRRNHAMSASEAARAVGLPYTTYCRLEQGVSTASELTKKDICKVFSCEIGDILWPTVGKALFEGLKPRMFQAGQIYVLVPVNGAYSGAYSGASKQATRDSKKKRLMYLRDSGKNHVFLNPKHGGLECFIDAQLMDYVITKK